MRGLSTAIVLGVLQLTAVAALAATDDNTEAARRLYESATRHFDLTEYEAALNDFKEGFRHKDDPVFLYNIAQCYRLMNQNDEALKFYRNYLRRAPNAPNRDEVERRIATLQESIAVAERARQTPPQGTLPPTGTPAKDIGQQARGGSSNATSHPAAGSESGVVVATAPPPRASQSPVYKKWWLWTAVGVVAAAGVGVGLGISLSQQSSRSFPGVTF